MNKYNYIFKNKTTVLLFINRALIKIAGFQRIQQIKLFFINRNHRRYRIQSILPIDKISVLGDTTSLEWICKKYLSHRVDYLGSGWVDVGYNSKAIGVNGFNYDGDGNIDSRQSLSDLHKKLSTHDLKIAEKICRHVDKEYNPINWQRDFKCGYCWKVKSTISTKDIFGAPQGADIKTCWELGRMHHLVKLAIYALSDKSYADVCIKEFKNQVLDFIAFNPPGKGTQWSSPMEISIRATNLLIANDIFTQIDSNGILNNEFKDAFSSSIYKHGRLISSDLEIDIIHGKRNNHYLSNLVGLLYISAYFDKIGCSKVWWKFAKSEFIDEVSNQFFDDGSNFEGSTSYHRLGGELLVYGSAIIMRVDGGLPQNLMERVEKAGEFSLAIRKGNGEVIQIGDNDSGSLFKFSTKGKFFASDQAEKKYINLKGYCKNYFENEYFDEELINHDSLISAISGLIDNPLFKNEKKVYHIEASIVEAISGHKPRRMEFYNFEKNIYKEPDLNTSPNGEFNIITTVFSDDISLNNGNWKIFNNFGLCCYKSEGLELYVNIGRNSDTGINGHIHNDILHIEICIANEDVTSDPGTYVYTSLPEKRDEFRSCHAHFVPDYGEEPNKFNGVFAVENKVKCWIDNVKMNSITCVMKCEDIIHYRVVEIMSGKIVISDFSNKDFEIKTLPFKYVSSGYGKISKVDKRLMQISSEKVISK